MIPFVILATVISVGNDAIRAVVVVVAHYGRVSGGGNAGSCVSVGGTGALQTVTLLGR